MKKLFSVSCLILSLLGANLSAFAAPSSSMSEEAVVEEAGEIRLCFGVLLLEEIEV